MQLTGPPNDPKEASQLEFPFYGRTPERIGKDERNIMEWIIGVLGESAPEGVSKIEYRDDIWTSYPTENDPGGKKRKVTRILRVRVMEGEKLPSSTERDVLIALSAIQPQNPETPDTVYFTIYELCKIMGKMPTGKNYARIAEAIVRWKGTEIQAINAFFDKEGNMYVNVSTGIFQDIGIADRSARGAKSWVTFTRVFRNSIELGYFWFLDLDFYFSLKTPLEKRLFQLLNGKRHGNEQRGYQVELRKWAFEHVGVSRNYAPSQIKRELDKAHRTLIRRGFLKSWDYSIKGQGEWQVHYQFATDEDASLAKAQRQNLSLPLAPDKAKSPMARKQRSTELEDQDLLEQATEADWEEARRLTNEYLATELKKTDFDTNGILYTGSVRNRLLKLLRARQSEP